LALRHNAHQRNLTITAFGIQAEQIRQPLRPGLAVFSGGDLGGESWHSYLWLETTGAGFSGDWRVVERLPKYTVIGLKHNRNQSGKVLFWAGRSYDPACGNCPPPPGFVRVVGGDRGARSGVGYMWYEKVTGPDIYPN
jgi:hypothetical protein